PTRSRSFRNPAFPSTHRRTPLTRRRQSLALLWGSRNALAHSQSPPLSWFHLRLRGQAVRWSTRFDRLAKRVEVTPCRDLRSAPSLVRFPAPPVPWAHFFGNDRGLAGNVNLGETD